MTRGRLTAIILAVALAVALGEFGIRGNVLVLPHQTLAICAMVTILIIAVRQAQVATSASRAA